MRATLRDESGRTRGTGRTTRQMREAPRGAVYVWINGQTHYPRALAASLARRDLEIVRPEWLEQAFGRAVPIVIDHAVRLTPEQSAMAERVVSMWRASPERARK